MMTDPTQLFNGMKVISNPLCTTEEPVRVHIQKGTQRQAYHDRIQKKWNKRFGTKRVPGMYIMNQSYFTGSFEYGGGSEKVIIAHPVIIAQMKNIPPVDKIEKTRQACNAFGVSANEAADNFKRFGEALNKVGIRNPAGVINTEV